MPIISQVTMRVSVGKEAREIWFLYETDHPDLYEFNEDLVADGTVYGQRIETIPAGQGQRRETGRYEFILGSDAVVNVSPPQFELLPPMAEAAN